jgi:hypothetical protein
MIIIELLILFLDFIITVFVGGLLLLTTARHIYTTINKYFRKEIAALIAVIIILPIGLILLKMNYGAAVATLTELRQQAGAIWAIYTPNLQVENSHPEPAPQVPPKAPVQPPIQPEQAPPPPAKNVYAPTPSEQPKFNDTNHAARPSAHAGNASAKTDVRILNCPYSLGGHCVPIASMPRGWPIQIIKDAGNGWLEVEAADQNGTKFDGYVRSTAISFNDQDSGIQSKPQLDSLGPRPCLTTNPFRTGHC